VQEATAGNCGNIGKIIFGKVKPNERYGSHQTRNPVALHPRTLIQNSGLNQK
jgi:hypothetical protein